MNAVLVARATGRDSLLPDGRPRPLLPLLDRPFVQHVTEAVVGLGVTALHVFLDRAHEPLATALGDGRRWGVRCAFHRIEADDCPYALTWHTIRTAVAGPLLLGHADRLPALAAPPTDGKPLLFHVRGPGGQAPEWSGWVWLGTAGLPLPPTGLAEAELGALLAATAAGPKRETALLCVRSPGSFLASARAALDGTFPGLHLGGRRHDDGVRLGRGACVHREARLLPPVYVGEGARVRRGARVGPHAVIGARCVLDCNSVVSQAAVLPNTYVGPGVSLSWAVVDGPEVHDAHTGTTRRVDDECLLGRVSSGFLLEGVGRCCGRLAGYLWGATPKAGPARAASRLAPK